MKSKINTSKIFWIIFLLIAIFFILFPIYIMFKYSIADKASIVTAGQYPEPLWPFHPNLDQYKNLFSRKDFLSAGIYSLVISILTVFLSLLIGVPASFIFSRYKFAGIAILMSGVLIIRMFPDICSVIPVVEIFSKKPLFYLFSSLKVALAHTILSLPYVIFICIGVFDTIPKDLEEQAIILGSSRFSAFINIILPVAKTGLAAAAIYVFLLSWNEFIFAYFLLFQSTHVTLPVYLNRVLTWTPQRNFIAAISVLLSLPVILFTFLVQKYIVSGMTAGAVK